MKKRLLSAFLTLTMVLSLAPATVWADEPENSPADTPADSSPSLQGTVEALTPEFTHQNEDTKAETVDGVARTASVIDVTTTPTKPIPYSDINSEIGRNQAGWWAGIKIEAPASVTSDTVGKVRFRNSTNAADREWDEKIRDGGTGTENDLYWMGAWKGVTEDDLKLAGGKESYKCSWYFNWDGDPKTGVTVPVDEFSGENAGPMAGVDQIINFTFELNGRVRLMAANGTDIAWPKVQTVKTRGDGVEDETLNADYAAAYRTAGLTLSEQPTDGAYTLTIKKTDLEKVVTEHGDTYQILENTNNKKKLWFGMEYTAPEGMTGVKSANVQFDDAGDFTPVELNNKDGDGFYNYIKVYDGTEEPGQVGPVECETATIEWLSEDDKILAVTRAVVNVVVDDSALPETKFTITFDANGGSVSPSSAETKDDGTLDSLPTPTRAGFTFDGWYTAAEGGEPVTTSTKFSGPVTIYAHWKAEYVITFDANGGTVNSAKTADVTTKEGKIETYPVPVYSGYTFKGWYTAAEGGVLREKDDAFSGNTTLYAHWEKDNSGGEDKPAEYTITFDANGGTVNSAKTADVTTKEGKIETYPVPVYSGYTFDNWYTAAEGGDLVEKDHVFTANTTLYAHWKENSSTGEDGEYVIRIYSNIRHGNVYTSDRFAEPGTRVTITVDPDTDYELDWIDIEREDGRYLDWDQSGRRFTFTMPASDVTVDASFTLWGVYNTYMAYQPEISSAQAVVSVPKFTPVVWRPAAAMVDVPGYSWAYPAAQWAYQNGYLDTAADGTFDLNGPVSHQQMWKIMAQWLGTPVTDERSVASWALQNGAARGKPAAGAMTRQNVVEYLYQCYFLMGGDVSVTGNLANYSDSRLITAEPSKNAWIWAVEKGIISGTADGYLNPNRAVSRGEFAAILMRLCQNVMG